MWHPTRGKPAASGVAGDDGETEEGIGQGVQEREQGEAPAAHIALVRQFAHAVAARAEAECLARPHGELLMALAKHLCDRDRHGGYLDAICMGQSYAEPCRGAKHTAALVAPFRTAWECYLPDAAAALELMQLEADLVVKFLNSKEGSNA